MEEINLKAMPRTEKPNRVRNAGFIPGVLNDSNTVSTSVQFETVALSRIIAKHGSKAKLWILMDNEKKFGFIKEVQKNLIDGKIIHIVIQLVSKDQEIKMQFPITFRGHLDLEHKHLQLQVHKSEIEVMGKAAFMPDEVVVDVSQKQSGENITVLDFHLPPEIKTLDSENEIYAVVKNAKAEIVEAPEEVKPA